MRTRIWPFGLTLIELLVIFAIIGILAAITVPALVKGAPTERALQTHKAVTETVFKDGFADVYRLKTVNHDAHWFVVYGQNGVIHHPGCPCLK